VFAAGVVAPLRDPFWKEKIMSCVQSFLIRRMSRCVAFALVAYFGVVAAYAQALAAEPASTAGRIDFDEAKLPPATVEIDLSEGMFGDLLGLGEAAVAGVVEQLQQAAGKTAGAEGTRLAAEQLAAAQQILELARGVVQEVRVRVYEDVPDDVSQPAQLMAQYDEQLQAGNWENVVRVRDGDDNVRVSLLRDDGAVRGAFIIVSDGSDLVLANVVGNVSPENVKKLTSAAAKIGLENGLQQALEVKMRQLHRRLPPHAPASSTVPAPPQPPSPPQPEESR
jgi:hypothetical protein